MVITTVEIAAPLSAPNQIVKRVVAMDAEPILTMLFPIRMVEIMLSYFSATCRVLAALWSPLSAIFFNRILLMLFNAVSDAEKNAESATKTTNNM